MNDESEPMEIGELRRRQRAAYRQRPISSWYPPHRPAMPLQEGALLHHKDIEVAALLHREGPGTITVILHYKDMVVAHLDRVVAQLHCKDIVVAVLLHQEDTVLHHLGTTAQVTSSVVVMSLLITENTKEVQQTTTDHWKRV